MGTGHGCWKGEKPRDQTSPFARPPPSPVLPPPFSSLVPSSGPGSRLWDLRRGSQANKKALEEAEFVWKRGLQGWWPGLGWFAFLTSFPVPLVPLAGGSHFEKH